MLRAHLTRAWMIIPIVSISTDILVPPETQLASIPLRDVSWDQSAPPSTTAGRMLSQGFTYPSQFGVRTRGATSLLAGQASQHELLC